MKKVAIFCCLLFSISFSNLQAQVLKFDLQFQGKSLELDKEYILNGNPITISKCKFYISNIQFGHGRKFQAVKKMYHLIDLEKPASLSTPIIGPKGYWVSFLFDLGVDSIRSVSGVYGNDLDPTNGMYWAWQSGYINTKIEGYTPICPARKNKFQFHLGGYAYPNNSLQKVNIESTTLNKKGQYVITIALDKFFESIDLSKEYEIMSPSKRAVALSKTFSSVFQYEK